MSFPANDENYTEGILKDVVEKDGGYQILREFDYGCLFLNNPIPIVPKEGMVARYYSDHHHGFIRGIFIDGVEIYYHTKDEYALIAIGEMYGKNAVDMLKKWDSGEIVRTVAMGGIGPAYEQAIQVTMFEVLRYLIALKCSESEFENSWHLILESIEKTVNPIVSKLGLSGAQWNVAVRLATQFYRYAPMIFFQEGLKKKRLILVDKSWPCLESK